MSAPHQFQPGNELYKLRERKPITDAIHRIIIQEASGNLDAGRLRKGLDKLFDDAAKGDIAALTFIRDTVQGKPAQALTIEDSDGLPAFKAIRLIVVQETIPNAIKDIPVEVIE